MIEKVLHHFGQKCTHFHSWVQGLLSAERVAVPEDNLLQMEATLKDLPGELLKWKLSQLPQKNMSVEKHAIRWWFDAAASSDRSVKPPLYVVWWCQKATINFLFKEFLFEASSQQT